MQDQFREIRNAMHRTEPYRNVKNKNKFYLLVASRNDYCGLFTQCFLINGKLVAVRHVR